MWLYVEPWAHRKVGLEHGDGRCGGVAPRREAERSLVLVREAVATCAREQLA